MLFKCFYSFTHANLPLSTLLALGIAFCEGNEPKSMAFNIAPYKDTSLENGNSVQEKHINKFLQGLECNDFFSKCMSQLSLKIM